MIVEARREIIVILTETRYIIHNTLLLEHFNRIVQHFSVNRACANISDKENCSST